MSEHRKTRWPIRTEFRKGRGRDDDTLDWAAWIEECDPIGYGSTEAEAIADLHTELEKRDPYGQ